MIHMRKKTCTKCFKCLKVYLTCFKCDAVYHAKCLLKVPGFRMDQKGHAFCCRNITFESDFAKEILASEERLVIVKWEEEYAADKGLENCLPDEEDSEQNNFKCQACRLEFTNEDHLKGHYRECPYVIQGGLIREINTDKDLKNCLHKEEVLECNEFKCDACSSELTNEQHLEDHYRECPDKQRGLLQGLYKDKASLVCPFCEEENVQERSYEQHIKQCEAYYLRSNKGDDVRITSTKRNRILSKHYDRKKPSTRKPFICNQCDYQTALNGSLKLHMNVKHSNAAKEYKCSGSRDYAAVRKANLNLTKHSTSEKKYKCSDCKYSTHKKSTLVAHIRTHTNERPFKCDTCSYTAIRRCDLNTHVSAKHSDGEKKYKCSDCKYLTSQKSNLVRHTRTHSNERPFKCDTCNYAAIQRCDLNCHVLANHSGAEKIYKCGDCEYSSHHRTNLEAHARIHANERPFKCDTCSYAATLRSTLTSHILTKHSNTEQKYKCGDCKYTAHKKWQLVRHVRIHTNERPFKCATCTYSATAKRQLTDHILAKHSNAEKKYKCGDCKYSTHQKTNLITHVRRIHQRKVL